MRVGVLCLASQHLVANNQCRDRPRILRRLHLPASASGVVLQRCLFVRASAPRLLGRRCEGRKRSAAAVCGAVVAVVVVVDDLRRAAVWSESQREMPADLVCASQGGRGGRHARRGEAARRGCEKGAGPEIIKQQNVAGRDIIPCRANITGRSHDIAFTYPRLLR